MNIVALIASVTGLFIIMLIVLIGNKIKHQILRFLILVSGTFMAVGVTGNIPHILGDPAISTSAKAVEYLLYLGTVYLLIQAVFKIKKSSATNSNQKN